MTPYTFTPSDSRNLSNRMTLRFAGKNIFPSLMLSNFLGINEGSHVAFMIDLDKPENIYIRKTEDNEVYTSVVSMNDRLKGKLSMSAKAVVNHVLSTVRSPASFTCYVAAKPITIDGKKYYRILTNQPYN